jgi:hypothetical protein
MNSGNATFFERDFDERYRRMIFGASCKKTVVEERLMETKINNFHNNKQLVLPM